MTTFNDAIRERRQELGLSLSELGRRADVSKAYLHRLERPGSVIRPSVDVARRLCDALGFDPAEILTAAPLPRRLPHGLAELLADEGPLDSRDLAALTALAPFAPEDAPADEWRFVLEALRRSVLAPSEARRGRRA